ncbi:MAG: hypothetical protein GY730_04345 [bacterium]|nr:hypothetical protein [bacterium]
MNDILNPYIERGEKNKLLLDPDVIPIFDYIKQDKDKGFSLPTIKRNLINSDILLKKDIKTINEESEADCQTLPKSTKNNSNGDEWLSIKDAAYLSKKSEATIKRVIISEFKHDHSRLKKDDSSKRGKWLISKKFLLDHFSIKPGHVPVYDPDRNLDYNRDHDKNNIGCDIVYNQGQPVNHQESHIVELLEKQIAELKEQLKQKDDQLKNQAENFKDQLSQKDQQIHQLHVLLQESKTSTIDYKPDDKVGVFSKVLMRFGL